MQVFARGVESFLTDPVNAGRPMKLIPKLSCEGDEQTTAAAAAESSLFNKNKVDLFSSRRRSQFSYEGSSAEDEDDRKLETRWSFGETFHK